MNFYDQFAEWLFSPDRTPLQRTIITVFGIAGFLFINDVLDLSYYYVMQQKTSDFAKLTAIINAPGTDSTSKTMAVNLRKEIIERKPYSFVFLDFLNGNSPSSQDSHQTMNSVPNAIKQAENASIKNQILFITSAGGIYLFFAFINFSLIFFRSKNISVKHFLLLAPTISIMLTATATLLYLFCNSFPAIAGHWGWNYLVNMIIQISSWLILAPVIRKWISSK